jgi:DNA-binding Lrp family transcriptional regulator
VATEARTIDDLDRSILERLRVDGRETNRSLAAALKVNEATIAARLRRLETTNFVHVVALTDMHRLGFPYFALGLLVVGDRPIAEVAREVAKVPQTIAVNMHTGRYGVTCAILARDRAELGQVIGEAIPRIDGVRAVRCELAVDVLRFDSAWAVLDAGVQDAKQPQPVIPPDALDDLDLRMIGALQQDARSSNRSIATALDVSEGTVRARLRRMEEEHLIRIRAVSDVAAFGLTAAATVGVHVADGKIEPVGRRLMQVGTAAAVIRTVGEFDYVLICSAEDRATLLDVALNDVARIPGVRGTETFEHAGTVKHIYTWARLI